MTFLQTDCLQCRGTGWVWDTPAFEDDDVSHEDCPACDGTGKEIVDDEELLEIIENAGAIK
ncbi:MAG: hypothetical protein Unbinned5079contig1000_18 [Prokaryotic dsDNA virus sp.]|nr:MAG: hypothetical protein Unbinned5079contig1000_18 [Prokaryotic dsDNA virus sp.]|tara:strand:- start:2749 stop:2931 length:183 start_codon:yes stop_codon:yes gene_type:complete